ncbi:MAG TPA: crosslink repair DNA glycosylase YcaQ family protein [Gaiellales bacterium]|nr:crosslink repair DNA glycosylase YcaQ family protein [Gaiellales bacterium]
MSRTVSTAELRRRAVAAQGYASRTRRGRPAEVAAAVDRLGCVQLDSISAVERSHRITLAGRVGSYPRGTVSKLLGQGRIFEYWAHEACLVPIGDWPVWRRRMHERRSHHWFGPVIDRDPELADRVLSEIRERGPLGSRDFEGARSGGMWGWKPARRMLDALWTAGDLVVSGRNGFQRLYDLPERVIPDEILGAPTPGEDEFLRALVLRAVRARGVLTEYGVVEHNRLRGGTARIRPHVDALVADGALERLEVADGGPPVLVASGPRPAGSAAAAVLLSPFDNLLWDRPFAARVLGFEHLIEVYKPPPERRYGYYVLPFLLGDRIVARLDIRSDRRAGVLRVLAHYPEPRVRWGARHEAGLERALERLAATVGLEQVQRADLGAKAASPVAPRS